MAPASKRWSWIVALTLAALVVAACLPDAVLPTEIAGPSATPAPGEGPASISGQVWDDICIVVAGAPGMGCVLAPDGQYRANALRDLGEPGFSGVLVTLGLGQCPSAAWALTTLTDANGAYTFIGLPQAEYCVTVDPGAVQNAELGGGSWTQPEAGAGLAPAGVNVVVGPGENKGGVGFGRDRQYVPAPATATELPTAGPSPTGTQPATAGTPTPTGTGGLATPSVTPSCSNLGEFVSDVTIPDNTTIGAGKSFVKTWRLRNTGTCTWYSEYSLVFFTGNQMGSPAAVPLPGPVAPGTTIDLSLTLVAPSTNGTYKGEWRLRSDTGTTFGMGPLSDKSIWTQIKVGTTSGGATATRTRTTVPGGGGVPRTSTPTPTRTRTPTATTFTGWTGNYYNNKTLAGSPVLTRNDGTLDFNWGSGVPGPNVPADNFSVRWTRTTSFNAGTYKFRLIADDGARLWVDDVLIIDDWADGPNTEKTVDVGLTAGNHSLKVEYYENGGDAIVKVWWEVVGSPGFPNWKGEYWGNTSLSGTAALTRNDLNPDFNWGTGAPAAGLPADNFSARWSRTQAFDAGTYRFSAFADDGIRVYVDSVLRINEWHGSDGSVTYTADVVLTAANHTVVVEYYEGTGNAKAKLTWAKLNTATPTPTVTVTQTPTGTPSPTATPTVTVTPTETATATATATSTETATPTETATATATDESTTIASVLTLRKLDAARQEP